MDEKVKKIKYRDGYRYQLVEMYTHQVDIAENFISEYISINNGLLTVHKGYAWDGATSAVDTQSFMRGSLVHDALYQSMEEGFIPWSYRRYADDLLIEFCKEDGMPAWRRWYVRIAVRNFGKSYSCSNNKGVLVAP